jgi:hypothetical protein
VRRFIRTIRSSAPEANWLALASLLLLLPKIIWWDEVPEAFPNAHKAGVVWEAILVSLLASYVFYFLVVHIKEEADKAVVRPAIHRRLNLLLARCTGPLAEFARATNQDLDFEKLTKEQIESAFSQIDPNGESPMVVGREGSPVNWLYYNNYHVSESKQMIPKILEHLVFLDARTAALLAEIENCHYFHMITMMQNVGVSNKNLDILAKHFFDYVELCRKLRSLNLQLYAD